MDTLLDDGTPSPRCRKALNTKVEFPKDFIFTPPKPQCDPAVIAEHDDRGCTRRLLVLLRSVRAAAVLDRGAGHTGIVPAVVTAFNGTPNGGIPVVLLHEPDGMPRNTTTVLIGTLRTSDQGPQFGKMLDVIVPTLPLTKP